MAGDSGRQGPKSARFGPVFRESLSRKRVINPVKKNPNSPKKNPQTPWAESPDVPAMRTILQTSPCEPVQLTLMVALLAACAANVALVWAWL